MADNVNVTEGSGKTVATDEIAGAQYQRIKIVPGNDGANEGDVSSTNPLPVAKPASANDVIMRAKSTDANVIYIGEAANGTLTSAAVWRITRLDLNTLLDITYADGNVAFDNVWNNRESLSYT